MTAIAHAFAEELTAQSHTGDTAFTDVSANAVLPSSGFVAGQKYLILISCQTSLGVSSSEARLRVIHGTTQFDDSVKSFEPNLSATKQPYLYFVVWTAVSSEAIKLQHAVEVSSVTVTTDQVQMFAMRLDADLTENTDWFYNENTTSNPLGTTFEDGASVTWTPGTANDIWLLLHRHRATCSGVTSQGESRADLSGGTAANWGLWSEEGEDSAQDNHYHSFARAISLPASSHTFKVQGRSETANVFTHTHSAVFALNLSKFKDVSQVFTATAVGYSTTAWASAIQTLSHTKTVNGDVLILAAFIDRNLANTTTYHARVQVDGADQPSGQTTDDYPLAGTHNDASDQAAFGLITQMAITASITIDLDGHSNVATTPEYSDRALVCFSMELAGAGAQTLTPSAVASVYSISAPTVVKGARTLTPSAIAAVFSIALPNVSQGTSVTPDAIAAAFSIPTPAVLTGGVVLTPAAVSSTYGVFAPTLAEGPVVLTPNAVEGVYVVLVPFVDTGGAGPAVLALTFMYSRSQCNS